MPFVDGGSGHPRIRPNTRPAWHPFRHRRALLSSSRPDPMPQPSRPTCKSPTRPPCRCRTLGLPPSRPAPSPPALTGSLQLSLSALPSASTYSILSRNFSSVSRRNRLLPSITASGTSSLRSHHNFIVEILT